MNPDRLSLDQTVLRDAAKFYGSTLVQSASHGRQPTLDPAENPETITLLSPCLQFGPQAEELFFCQPDSDQLESNQLVHL